jgi:hypothetical protein
MMHPVTKEELEQIREFAYNDNCITISRMVDTVLARPDPLEVLRSWLRVHPEQGITTLIRQLQDNPDAVIAKGKAEGWL